MGHADPLARHVSSASAVRLRHPTPDQNALQRAFVENVRKLERSAEELSAGGSDIGEEIRKMNELSRQSSLQSSRRDSSTAFSPTTAAMSAPWSQAAPATARRASQHTGRSGHQPSLYSPSEHRRSMDTFQEAQVAFHDFDGVHFSPETHDIVETDQSHDGLHRTSIRSLSGRQSLASSSHIPAALPPPQPRVVPPPAEGMAYYPAPVPRMLNLPKRLSQLPAATVQSKRKTQILNDMSQDAGAAAPWLSPGEITFGTTPASRHSRAPSASSGAPIERDEHNRMSSGMLNLPPHARAELFFKHQPVQQNVEMQSGSVVATLDNILAASATAPVSAFTDHPFAGDVRKSVYAREYTAPKSASTADLSLVSETQGKKRRSGSITGLLRRVASSDDVSTTLKIDDPRSSALTLSRDGPRNLQKRRSSASTGNELDRPQLDSRSDAIDLDDIDTASLRQETDVDGDRTTGEEEFDDGSREAETQEDVEGDTVFVKPSTLLAELQVRKAQQKSRSRTAATAFPNGMHSTLLELDAVQQVTQQNRKGKKVALAWEDPNQRALQQDAEAVDEDTPLGVLFTGRDGRTHHRTGDARDWDRPLGLMDRRNLEDDEPLSSRRNRLKGLPPTRRQPQVAPELLVNGRETEEDNHDNEHETLAQRLKRMKATDAPIPQEDGNANGFAQEVLNQFDGLDVGKRNAGEEKPASVTKPAPSPDNEESLAQRRARLQREREANGVAVATGTLPYANNAQPQHSQSGLLAIGQGRVPSGGYGASAYTNGMGGVPLQNTFTPPMFGANGFSAGTPYSAPGTGRVTAFPTMQTPGHPQFASPSQPSTNPSAYGALFGNQVLSPQTMSTGLMGNAYNPGVLGGTYAAYAQRKSTSDATGLVTGMNNEHFPGTHNPSIDRWRLGVQR